MVYKLRFLNWDKKGKEVLENTQWLPSCFKLREVEKMASVVLKQGQYDAIQILICERGCLHPTLAKQIERIREA